ncbi:MAG: gliding motility-associated C-terminal domain-containing protein [Saprospiraceae bacterium]
MMKFYQLCVIIFGLVVIYPIAIKAQSTAFQKLYYFSPYVSGSNKFIHTNFYEIEAMSDGGFATIGFVTDTNNISQGVLSRYDCIGNVLWTKMLGNSGAPTNTVMGIAETDSSDLVFTFPIATGFFQASTLIGRIDKTGKVKWMKRIGNNTEFGRDIVRTKDGGFVIAGSTGSFGTDNVADDVYLFKIDASGNVLWTKTFGNPAGTYDEAFAITVDSKDNLIVTGSCIAEGTFQGFILKADPNGNPIKFKTYGYTNQRTYAFAVLVDSKDNYLITGSTTILEIDHQSSEYDVFLIKTDSSLNTIFSNIYETNTGSDAGAIGEGLALSPDGNYVIGVSTYAFSNHNASGPNSPSKNSIYVINEDGSINKALIYNRKGSQYTRVRTTKDGFYICGFSTAYANNVNFQGLIIKTDQHYLSGCNDIDVTQELSLNQELWNIADFSYQTKSGTRSINYSNYRDSSLKSNTLCETTIELNPSITGPVVVCPGQEFVVNDQSSGTNGSKHVWLLNGNPYDEGKKDLKFSFSSPGIYKITKIMTYACISKSFDLTVEVNQASSQTTIINAEFCKEIGYELNGTKLYQAGQFNDTIMRVGSCDSIVVLNLKELQSINDSTIVDSIYCNIALIRNNTNIDKPGTYIITTLKNSDGCVLHYYNLIVIDGGCEDCVVIPNVFTPNDPMDNKVFRPVIPPGCVYRFGKINFEIYNRWGKKIFNSDDLLISGWNGEQSGKPAPADSYVYVLNYELKVGDINLPKVYKRKGIFNLIR